jgi:starvation-inducible outer membrane lipoprotein
MFYQNLQTRKQPTLRNSQKIFFSAVRFKNRLMKHLFSIAMFFSITACASVTDTFEFNGSSAESIESDISYIMSKLPQRKQLEFIGSLMQIQLSDVDTALTVLLNPELQSMNYDILSKKLDGLTYGEVLELASQSETKINISSN